MRAQPHVTLKQATNIIYPECFTITIVNLVLCLFSNMLRRTIAALVYDNYYYRTAQTNIIKKEHVLQMISLEFNKLISTKLNDDFWSFGEN